jgi:phosphatidylglycerol:prolipoprotein diacylglycerol transferase
MKKESTYKSIELGIEYIVQRTISREPNIYHPPHRMSIFTLHILGVTLSPTYYGLAYAMGFLLGYHILKNHKKLSIPALDSLLMYIFLGVILGGRLGYVLFYHFAYFVENPLKIPAMWEGGMSFHGGVIGVVLALYIYAYRKNISVYTIGDEVCSILPIGI